MAVELHPHQEDAVAKMHNGCVLNGDVGSGKTITALAYALLKEAGRDIYVITTAKKRDSMDWQNEAAKLGVIVDKLFVDSWNNIGRYTEVEEAVFLLDEQRLVGTGAWVKSFYKIAAKNRWVLLSATPGDTWLDYAPVFIANGFFKNITEFREKHVVYTPRVKFPKVKKYLGEDKLTRLKWAIMVEMPMERHTTRHIETIDCDYDKEMFTKLWKHRWNVYDDCPVMDAGELFRVGRKVVASSESRLNEVRRLLTIHPKLIVFYNFDYELEILRSLAESQSSTSGTSSATRTGSSQSPNWAGLEGTTESGRKSDTWTSEALEGLKGTIWEPGFDESNPLDLSNSTQARPSFAANDRNGHNSAHPDIIGLSEGSFAIAEWNGHKHEKVPNTDKWVYLVQYNSGSEGWNCTSTDAMVFYSLTYSYKQFYQAQGRIDRMNTRFKDLHYYVLTSRSVVDRAVWRALEQKKDFNIRSKW